MSDILIMEPDQHAADAIRRILNADGHQCTIAVDIAGGIQLVQERPRLLALLNAQLPWTDSVSLLRALEEKGCPVLFMTADAGNADHLRAMYQRVCDVLTIPFSAQELSEAVRCLLEAASRMLTLGALCLDVNARTATLDGHDLALTAQEFALLQALMLSPDAALTREQLLRTAWGYQDMGETRTVDVHIQRLRRKLGPASIETVYKLGYRLKMA